MYSKNIATVLSCIAFLFSIANAAENPIRIIVPFAPGGSTDQAARIVAAGLSPILGVPVIVEHKAGAGGLIGTLAAAKAPPDGTVLYIGNISTMGIYPALQPTHPAFSEAPLIPISKIADITEVLLVNNASGITSVDALVQRAKLNPGKLGFATVGSGSVSRMETELFKKPTGVLPILVPYQGGGPALNAMLGEHITAMFSPQALVAPHFRAGTLRPLAVTSTKRISELPDVPTFLELGFPSLQVSSWQALFAPRGTPLETVDRIFNALKKVLNDPENQKKFAAGGMTAAISASPSEFASYVKADVDRWSTIVREEKITAD